MTMLYLGCGSDVSPLVSGAWTASTREYVYVDAGPALADLRALLSKLAFAVYARATTARINLADGRVIHHFASTRDAEIAANVSLAPFLPRVTALYVAGFEPCAAAYAALPNLAVIYASEYELGYVSVPEPFLPLVEYFVDEQFLDTVGAYSPDGPWKWIKKDCLACRAREEGEG